MSNIYLTTAIPYVNGDPHIGHALDYLLGDTYARYQKLLGNSVRLQTGTDEHGNKVFAKAEASGLDISDFTRQSSQKFQKLISKLNVEATDFIRTTDPDHIHRCQAIWQKLENHIYSADYVGWYCEGCERFVTQKEYDEDQGACQDHQCRYKKLVEKNYYLRLADFKDRIRSAIESGEMRILPEFRKKEILNLLDDAPDVSISRPKKQLSWGIPVPGDDSQVMYVWMDALPNYITVLGYPDQDISDFWPADAQFIGKDILRFHAILWPAILLGLDLPLPKVIHSHGYVTTNGQKMSKSVGNVIDPFEAISRHGVEAFRYFFLRHIDTFIDSDFTWEKFDTTYNNELANDLGNLIQRLATLANKNQIAGISDFSDREAIVSDQSYLDLMQSFEFTKAFDYVWGQIQDINKRIDLEKPWELAKNRQQNQLSSCLSNLNQSLLHVGALLLPFLPNTAHTIIDTFTAKTIIPPSSPLFPKTTN